MPQAKNSFFKMAYSKCYRQTNKDNNILSIKMEKFKCFQNLSKNYNLILKFS